MRWKANNLVDRLANEGTSGNIRLLSLTWKDLEEGHLFQEFEWKGQQGTGKS